MPPKVKITKEDIIKTAIDIVRDKGAEAINARNVAAVLNCSTQPIFSNFENMEQLKQALVAEAYRIFWQRVEQEIAGGKYPAYKASGMAYIHFALEERELFRLLYMRDRREELPGGDEQTDRLVETQLQTEMGMDEGIAKRFHLEMWTVVHGFATMLVTGFVPLDEETISNAITDVYQGLKARFGI